MENLTGKIAVITGAASGIGKALAIECLQRGMNVVLADINQVLLKATEQELKYTSPALLCPAYVRTPCVEGYKEEDFKTEYAKKHFQGFKHKVDTGISPTDCAQATFNALENDEFYIFIHPTDDIQEIEVRQKSVLAHTLPYS